MTAQDPQSYAPIFNSAPDDARTGLVVHEIEEQDEDDESLPFMVKIMIAVIALNMLEVGAEQQWRVEDLPDAFYVYFTLDILFAIAYVSEAIMLIREQGWSYFKKFWELMSFILSCMAVLDVIIQCGTWASPLFHSLLRKTRMFRFLRVFRVLNMLRSVPDLQMVIGGLFRSLESIGWVMLLIVIMIYSFAIFITLVIDNSLYGDDFNDIDYFGDMSHTILTLIDIAILAEWGEIVRPVWNHQPLLVPLLLCFALVSSFGMLNVMIGVIVDSTAGARKEVEDKAKIKGIQRACKIWIKSIHDKGLSEKDLRKSTGAELEAKKQGRHEAIIDILQYLLDHQEVISLPSGLEAEDILSLLDFDGSGELNHAEFKVGLERLLLGEPFQLTCLTLTVLGKLRKERSNGHDVIVDRMDSLEKIVKDLADGQASIQKQLQDMAAKR